MGQGREASLTKKSELGNLIRCAVSPADKKENSTVNGRKGGGRNWEG